MKFLRTSTVAAGLLAFILAGGCAHHNSVANTSSTSDTGTITTDHAAQAGVIPGPAKVDNSGNVYTSSAAPGSGNASTVGTNTNVNNIPTKPSSTVSVAESTITQPTATTEVTTTTVTTTPLVPETSGSMSSSTTTEEQTTTPTTTTKTTTKRHRRVSKD
ncbi:MAG TPA: hypothetical protein VLV78_12030 [Thermoanaerobaculia bacterium]|nr:hypothetical protein [Thermoanaerobaculia bacterium]